MTYFLLKENSRLKGELEESVSQVIYDRSGTFTNTITLNDLFSFSHLFAFWHLVFRKLSMYDYL